MEMRASASAIQVSPQIPEERLLMSVSAVRRGRKSDVYHLYLLAFVSCELKSQANGLAIVGCRSIRS
jgi:hypothetical protein